MKEKKSSINLRTYEVSYLLFTVCGKRLKTMSTQ